MKNIDCQDNNDQGMLISKVGNIIRGYDSLIKLCEH